MSLSPSNCNTSPNKSTAVSNPLTTSRALGAKQAEAATTIKRRVGRPPFDIRREQMLADIQNMSAHCWTDFNAHDPGITILEQLAYALTDIDYRSDLSIEQLFADEFGQLDLNAHGMFSPEQAFPCRPVSPLDLQKFLLDSLPELAYVNVVPSPKRNGEITLHIAAQDKHLEYTALIEKVSIAYHGVRNLAETLSAVHIIPRQACSIDVDIHLDPQCDSVLALSQMYLLVEQFLIGDVRGGENPPATLVDDDGPRMTRQRISKQALLSAEQPRALSGLIHLMLQVDGVVSVENARVVGKNASGDYASEESASLETYAHFLPAVAQKVFDLDTSEQALAQLSIFQNGQLIDIDVKQVHAEIINLDNHKHSQRENNSLRDFSTSLNVDHIDLAQYASIQHQFPSNYGINAYGVPSHTDLTRLAQAKQLQGYLLLFDQIISDHALLNSRAKHLFSCSLNDTDSYRASEVIGPNPNSIRALRQRPQPADFLDNQWGYSIYKDRKQRALDYLIAINGRDKTLYSYQYSNPYLSDAEQAERTLTSAQCLLENQHTLAENRAAAMNLKQNIWQTSNISSLAQQINIRVSGAKGRCQSLCSATLMAMHCLSDDRRERVNKRLPSLFFRRVDAESLFRGAAERVPVPKVDVNADEALAALSYFFVQNNDLSTAQRSALLCEGAELGNYYIGHSRISTDSGLKKSIDLVMHLADQPDQSAWLYIASFKNLAEAALMANQLRHAFIEENSQIESLHLVEHILLSDEIGRQAEDDDETGSDFFCNQITAVFPAYSARLRDEKFRLYLEDMILRECPAHIYCHIIWLNADQMAEFEALYQPWLASFSGNSGGNLASSRADGALSDALSAYIRSHLHNRVETH